MGSGHFQLAIPQGGPAALSILGSTAIASDKAVWLCSHPIYPCSPAHLPLALITSVNKKRGLGLAISTLWPSPAVQLASHLSSHLPCQPPPIAGHSLCFLTAYSFLGPAASLVVLGGILGGVGVVQVRKAGMVGTEGRVRNILSETTETGLMRERSPA